MSKKNRLQQQQQIPTPVWPALRAVATCRNVTQNPDGSCALEGVRSGFVLDRHPTPQLPAPLSFFLYLELFAIDYETKPGDGLIIELIGDGIANRVPIDIPFSGGTQTKVHHSKIDLRVPRGQDLVIRLFWGSRFLAAVPVMIREPGDAPRVTPAVLTKSVNPVPERN